ncbi:hypothetical protein [Alkalihalobacillus sp. AL-G]|uniref:hypothetical protein n=1 Tax=Alkalihalobacillus sp. AL-G TaxID=2926399 RepID=UPI00272CAA0B|nr:hypothetical protein [Alkalihalobacillus sp. AL-G]WLD92868.1 hypothetical protein MOJ78_17965 [Alkalihalobacillus sp. AL-G]
MNDTVKSLNEVRDILQSSIGDIHSSNIQIRNSIDRLSEDIENLAGSILITNVILGIIAITFIIYVYLQFKKSST